jgi:hypothetical protein
MALLCKLVGAHGHTVLHCNAVEYLTNIATTHWAALSVGPDPAYPVMTSQGSAISKEDCRGQHEASAVKVHTTNKAVTSP